MSRRILFKTATGLPFQYKLKIGKRKKYEGELSVSQQQYLLGHVGSLEQEELESLLYEILTPVDRNFVMSDKQIDETVEKVSSILSKALNDLRYNSLFISYI